MAVIGLNGDEEFDASLADLQVCRSRGVSGRDITGSILARGGTLTNATNDHGAPHGTMNRRSRADGTMTAIMSDATAFLAAEPGQAIGG